MSWYSRPRQCEEVVLAERAIIRGTEGYHPHGRMQAKTPVNAGRRRSLETPARHCTGRFHPPRSSIRDCRRARPSAREGSRLDHSRRS
jgi:hypothetical protein